MASFFYTQQDTQADEPAPRRGLKLVKGIATQVASPALQARTSDLDSAWSSSLSQRRAEVQPPTLFSRARPAWKRWVMGMWQWLWDLDEVADVAQPLQGVDAVKNEFNTALWDLQSVRANQVRDLIAQARSLRELWHLRADVFRVVALHRGQSEAELRMESLDAHFPVKSSHRVDELRATKVTSW
ncbi:MAG: hypothetical protein KGI91_14245 [Burkholderiales bacterium]|nr:hypothetical protein [Burkholderiales bacterium]MDE2432759.1 hypothetical protein [Burkholderiales bacterium]